MVTTASMVRSGWNRARRAGPVSGAGQIRPSAIALAAEIIRRRCFERAARRLSRGLDAKVTASVASHGISVEEVVWDTGGGGSAFIFNPDVFDHPYGSTLIERWVDLLPLLMAAVSRCNAAAGITTVALGDCGTGRGLAFCDHRPDALLIPDPLFVRSDGYAVQKRAFAHSAVPWRERTPQALWRGQTSGWHDCQGVPIANWRELPRVRLCGLALEPECHGLIDVGITGIVQIADPSAAEKLNSSGLLVAHLGWQRFPHWRYQIDIDGNSSAWEGLFVKLCTSSPVLKIASGFGFKQWYYDRLVPWMHVVPVAADLSDLVEKVLWLRRHDDQAEAIGRAARGLVETMDMASETARAGDTVRRALAAGL